MAGRKLGTISTKANAALIGLLTLVGLPSVAQAGIGLQGISVFTNGDCGGSSDTRFNITYTGNGGDFSGQDTLVDFGGGNTTWYDSFVFYTMDAAGKIVGRTWIQHPVGTGAFNGAWFDVQQRPTVTGNFTVVFQDETDSSPDQALGATYVAGSGQRASLAFNAAAMDPDCVPGASDTTPPVISATSNISVNVDAGAAGAVVTYSTPTATDDMDGSVSVSRTAGLASGSLFPVGTTTVTHQASDAAGNTATRSFTVTVTDNEAPVITVPANIVTKTGAGSATAVVTYSVSANDVVDGAVSVTRTAGPASGAAFPVGTTTVTHQATDAAGNTATKSFTVTVSDDEAPVVSVPADITIPAPADALPVVSYSVSATDNVDGALAPTLVSGLASGSAFPVGTTEVVWQAIDSAGNRGEGRFNVTVQDVTPPDLSVPADISVGTDPGQATAVVTYVVTAIDAWDGPITPTRTAGPASGSAFPLGVTTVTHSATDAAGNTVSKSFSVTVTDNEVPVFTSTLPDIQRDIDFDQNSAIVTFPTPGATDNSGSVTVSQTAGLASGSAFPVGTTTVTFAAKDAAGGTATQSFTVTVTRIPAGVLTLVVTSAEDGTVTFSSPEPALNTSVAVSGGSGSTGGIQLKPGSYSVAYALPNGFALTSASCGSASGSVDTGANTMSLTFAPGESYTCTLQARDNVNLTTEKVVDFLVSRGRAITQSRPSQGRRLARVGGPGFSSSGSLFGNTVTRDTPLGFSLGANGASVSFSSMNTGGSASDNWDIWAEASYTRYDAGAADGEFAILHAGIDYRVSEAMILGFSAQIDHTDESDTASPGSIGGTGWMVGPYMTARLDKNLFLDASLSWGKAQNDISPFGTFSDSVGSERWLATLALFGSMDRGMLNIRPNVVLSYWEETTEAYVDSQNIAIPGVRTRQGDLSAGARFTWTDPDTLNSHFIEFDGIYTFDDGGTTLGPASPGEDFRAKVGLGGMMHLGASGVLDYSVSVDGIGVRDYRAVTLKLGYSTSF